MKNLIGLAAIAAALSVFALPAAAGGGHRGYSNVQHGLNRSTMPVTHFQARDLRDHGLGRDRARGGRHQYRQFRKHGRKSRNRTIIFNFGYTAPVVTYRRTRHFARRPLPTYVIRDRLHRSRYSRLGPIYLERGRYHVRARNGRGVRVKLVIHAASGAIVQRFYLR